jgi:hypothetical protein
MRAATIAIVAGVLATGEVAFTQARRTASPPGSSATEVGGRYDEREGYVAGRWITIQYGRPIKRGRDLFGTPDFAEALNDGAPVWRAGANATTKLITEVPLEIGDKLVAPGEYTAFVELGRDKWTFILSTWPAQTTYDDRNKTALWGAYDYTPDRDVVRVTMKVETLPHSFDQLAWQFLDMSDTAGTLALLWDRTMASVPFRIRS